MSNPNEKLLSIYMWALFINKTSLEISYLKLFVDFLFKRLKVKPVVLCDWECLF